MDLFDHAQKAAGDRSAPLAARMRPKKLSEFVGQTHLVGPGKLLRRMIEADRVPSLLFHGPPGTGKTTLAHIIAESTQSHFEQLNAVAAGVADVRRVLAEAEERKKLHGQRTILFIDEIHRFNKAQQDALLKAVEEGLVTFIGATTENPFFAVTGPLLSRARLFRLDPLSPDDLRTLAGRALSDLEQGLGSRRVEVEESALEHLVRTADGDARALLSSLELAVLSTPPGPDGVIRIDREAAAESSQRRVLRYDRDGDFHYDAASAFIKSMRGSDPDAALYWMARMLEAGEDPRFVARRIVIHAAEDVGNADPRALLVAVAAAQALEMLGLPEARIPLAQAAVYVATAPKSNASKAAIDAALEAVRKAGDDRVPVHLRDASYPGASRLGHGQGYLYPHDYPEKWVAQRYLPESLADAEFYRPTSSGYEREIAERLKRKNFTR
ncbi:MAG: replication-associated recombination protein A [Bacillota bacterium]|nr:replication-associated recombination protein A [Bacillota bacterium]